MIQDDFTIYPYSKSVRHTSGTTVYNVSAFYSWLMNVFDEPGYMTYQRPMKYNTPTSYTMLNGWYLDNTDGSNVLQYLTAGSIDTSGYATISDPVFLLDCDATTSWVAGDKDRTLVTSGTTAIGPLLGYKNAYPSAGYSRLWLRDTRAVPASIADNSTVVATGGTGTAVAYGSSLTGEEVYANIYTIASFPGSPDPQVYIFQNGSRVAEWSAFTNWDRGSVDVLIPIQLGGAEIATGVVTVYARQSADTYTFVEADLTGGARTPVATETATDTVNITKGEHYLLVDGMASGAFVVGNIIRNNSSSAGVPPSWYAEVMTVAEATDGLSALLTLRGLRGTIADNDNIYVLTDIKGVANGTPGDTYGTWNAEVATAVAGDLGKILLGGTTAARRILKGFSNDAGTTGRYVASANHASTITGDNRNPYYRAYNATETLSTTGDGGTMDVTSNLASTTIISGYSDITVAHINGTAVISGLAGTFIPGEKVTWNAGVNSAIYIKDTGSAITLANVDPLNEPDAADVFVGDSSLASAACDSGLTDANTSTFAFTLQSAYTYAIMVEGGSIYEAGRDLDDIYAYLQYILRDGSTYQIYTSDNTAITLLDGQEYIKPKSTYTASKVAPFGTLAGGVFFGAQGVWIQGMVATDANNIKLTDDNGDLQQPEVSVTLTIGNTRVNDVVTVYLESGSTTLPNKSQYVSHGTNNAQSDSTFERLVASGNFPNDTPTSGSFTVVDASANEEHRYRYASWTGGVLTLPTERTGTATSASLGQELVATAATFSTWGIQRGDIIRNTSDAGWGYITEIVSETEVTTTQLTTAGKDWATGDTFEINSLVVAYASADTFFIPYIDTIETVGSDVAPGEITATLTYTTDRAVVIRARNVATGSTEIQPFDTTSDITTGGMTVSIIRTEDTVYTP